MKNVTSEMTDGKSVHLPDRLRAVCSCLLLLPPAPAVCRVIFCPWLNVSLYFSPSFCAPLVTALR